MAEIKITPDEITAQDLANMYNNGYSIGFTKGFADGLEIAANSLAELHLDGLSFLCESLRDQAAKVREEAK